MPMTSRGINPAHCSLSACGQLVAATDDCTRGQLRSLPGVTAASIGGAGVWTDAAPIRFKTAFRFRVIRDFELCTVLLIRVIIISIVYCTLLNIVQLYARLCFTNS